MKRYLMLPPRIRSRSTPLPCSGWLSCCGLLLVGWLLVGNTPRAAAQKPPHVVQRERNPFVGGNWTLSKRGNVLATSTKNGTWLHFWTRDKFVSLDRAVVSTRFDLAKFTWRSDHLVFAKSESIEAYRQALLQLRQSVRYSPAALDAYEKEIDEAYENLGDNPNALEKKLAEIRKKYGIGEESESNAGGVNPSKSASKPFDIVIYSQPTRSRMSKFATIEAGPETGWVVLSGEGNRAALIDSRTNTINRVDLQSGFNAPNRKFENVLLPGPIFDATLTAKGGQLLAIQLGRVVLVDMDRGKLIQAMEIDPLWSDVHFVYHGQYIVAKEVADRAQAVIVQTKSGRQLHFDIEPDDQVTVTPDGRWLVRLSGDEVIFQKLADRNEVYREMLHDQCSQNSKMCFAAERGRMVIWSDEPARMYVVEYPFKRLD